ncbi:MMPL family transporter [Austwickia chelonae]|uniref:MMPL family transporter n=1 Tax=Austwickia chelonae TaxID=100225 RepID=UPI000E240B1D|nr:MMPL family transporter [Austwickia chelonae]
MSSAPDPAPTRDRHRVHPALTRRGAWISALVTLLALISLVGALRGATNETPSRQVPDTAESAQVDALRERFADARLATVIAVTTRTDAGTLTAEDQAAGARLVEKLTRSSAHPARGPIPSQDGKAAIVLVPVERAAHNTTMRESVERLRQDARDATPEGLQVQITGGPAFGADIAGAFAGADLRLLMVTIGVVALLLLLTYRSPVLLLLPLTVVGLADQAAAGAAARLGSQFGWQFDAGILSVLVFGAGTNYALLLISRYREELRRTEDHREALTTAWRAGVGAIVASNVTVVLALLCLALASLPATRGLGMASAVGLALALPAVLFVLPPALAVVGRAAFWPLVPRPVPAEVPSCDARPGLFERTAAAVVRRPLAVLLASLAVLAVLTTGMIGTRIGLSQAEKFRVTSESANGLSTLSAHFPAGESQPHTVVARAEAAAELTAALKQVPGIVRVTPTGTSVDGQLVRLSAVGTAAPDTEEAFSAVRALRETSRALPAAQALVGGPTATELDSRDTGRRDLLLVAPLILLVALVVLVALLQSLVAPLLLTLVNVLSALAAIGAGTFVGTHLFAFPALDAHLPLLAFLFLVALGIDYTIFLAHRIRHEATVHGTVTGTVRAVSATGVVITSAGLVLAAVFAALGMLPLVVLGQLGLVVGLGVLIDTLFVRTIVVPALFALVGDSMWRPGRLA